MYVYFQKRMLYCLSFLLEGELLDTILEDALVTYTLVEIGSQRNRIELVSSDGYEYNKKCSKWSKFIICQKDSYIYNKFQTAISPSRQGENKKIILRKEVKASGLRDIHHSARQIVEDVMLNNTNPDDHSLPKVNNLKRLANKVCPDLRPDEPRSLDFEVFQKLNDVILGVPEVKSFVMDFEKGWHNHINRDGVKANLTCYLFMLLLRLEANLVDIQQRMLCE